MKNRWIILLAVIALLIAGLACGGEDDESRSSESFNERCQRNWDRMEVEPGDESIVVDMILNREHVPNSVGEILQTCIRKGWDGWRP